MNKALFRTTLLGLFLFCTGGSFVSQAHEAADPLHATPIETLDSRIATPANIHVQETDKGVEVRGILKRRAGHKTQSLHGHVDVELLDREGQTLERATLPIKGLPGPARFDREREFSTILPVPSSPGYTVRVSHSIGADERQ